MVMVVISIKDVAHNAHKVGEKLDKLAEIERAKEK